MGFSRLEYWSGLRFPSPEDLSYPGIEPRSLALQSYREDPLFLVGYYNKSKEFLKAVKDLTRASPIIYISKIIGLVRRFFKEGETVLKQDTLLLHNP